MKWGDIFGVIAEEVGDNVVDEVRKYVAIGSILVVVIVLGLGVTLAARAVRAIEPEADESAEMVSEAAPAPARTYASSDSGELLGEDWGAEAAAAEQAR